MTDSDRPAPLNVTVSDQIKRMPRASSDPELAIRKERHRRDFVFRVNYSMLPGRSDGKLIKWVTVGSLNPAAAVLDAR